MQTLLHLLSHLWPVLALLIGVKLIESVLRRGKRRAVKPAVSSQHDEAVSALRSLGQSKAGAEAKVSAAIKQLGKRATRDDILRNALQRCAPQK